MHVGIDTVQLNGKHFEAKVQSGDSVKKGQLLLEFDVEGIKKEGYDVITSIIISNTPNYSAVTLKKTGDVAVGEEWMERTHEFSKRFPLGRRHSRQPV